MKQLLTPWKNKWIYFLHHKVVPHNNFFLHGKLIWLFRKDIVIDKISMLIARVFAVM